MADMSFIPTSSSLLSGMDSFTTAIIWILVLLIFGACAWFIWYYLQFKNPVTITQIASGRNLVVKTSAREFKSKEGINKWQTWFKKLVVAAPDAEEYDITSKGKKYAEAILLPDGTFTWRKRKIDLEKLANGEFEPFTSVQRTMQVQEYREADGYKRKKTSEMLTAALPYIIVLMILVIFMLFFNEAVAPTMAMGDKLIASQEKMNEVIGRLDVLINNRIIVSAVNLSGTVTGRIPE